MPGTRDPHLSDAAIASVEQQFTRMFVGVKATLRDRAVRVHPSLQPLSYNFLRLLVHNGPTRAGAIAAELSLDKSIVSRQANLLEELGLLQRLPDPQDGRASLLAATPDAVTRVESAMNDERTRLYDSLRDWDIEDLEKLAELLQRLNELR